MGIDGVNKWSLFLDWGTRISIFYTQKRAFPPEKHVFTVRLIVRVNHPTLGQIFVIFFLYAFHLK